MNWVGYNIRATPMLYTDTFFELNFSRKGLAFFRFDVDQLRPTITVRVTNERLIAAARKNRSRYQCRSSELK